LANDNSLIILAVLNLTVNEYQPFSGINTDRNPYLLLDRSIIEKIYLHSGESILYITVKKKLKKKREKRALLQLFLSFVMLALFFP
jgi:hypothetical protein